MVTPTGIGSLLLDKVGVLGWEARLRRILSRQVERGRRQCLYVAAPRSGVGLNELLTPMP
jgi:hypothetical protein